MQPRANAHALLSLRGMYDLPLARGWMVNVLSRRGFHPDVLQAMCEIPRHAFAPPQYANAAYIDRYLYVPETVLTTPSVVAQMTQQLELNPRKRVLEIGTGTGYQTAILALLSGHVFTVERVPELVRESAAAFAALGLYNISQRLGDGYEGWPQAAPFDAILIAAAPPVIPQSLVQQLHPAHGRMVLPVGPRGGRQRLCLVQRRGENISTTDLGPTLFVPMIPDPAKSTNQAQAGNAAQPGAIKPAAL